MAKKQRPLEKYDILTKTLPEGVLITDERGTLTYVNPALEEMFGIPSSVSLGTHFRNYVTPASAQNAEALFLGCAQGKIIRDVELEAVHQDQHTFPIEIAVSPILRDGKFQGVESVVRDITERKRAEKTLRESERRFRSTFENAAVGIAHVALDGRILQVNSRFCEIVGYSSPEILGKTCEEITPTEDWQAEQNLLQRLRDGQMAHYSIEKRCLHRDGNPVWVNLTRSIQRDEAGRPEYFVVLVEDISQRKHAERALRESEYRYRRLFEANLAGVYLTKPDGTILDFNEAMMRMLGYDTREEVFQHRSTDFYADPEFRTELILLLQRDGIVPAQEAVLRRKDGSTLHALGHAVLLRNEQTGEPYIQGVAIDITERRQAEETLRELTRMLENRVAQRTAELQQRARQLERITVELSETEGRERRRLAEILHDDLQQELAAAKFHVGRMRSQARYDAALQATAAQVDHMLKNAIAKSRSLSHELSPAVMHHADFAETLRWLANEVQTKHGLVVHVEADSEVRSESEAIKALLFRAAQELLFNVVKHARVREARLRVRQCDRCICLSVSDRGRGFDPHALGETAGFGLLSIRERVELLQGRMKIRSAPGQGSTFFLVVPQSETVGAGSEVETAATSRAGTAPEERGRLRILLADDHEITREGLLALLQDEHAVEVVGEAANGREAVDLAEQLHPDLWS
jgi:PAS domain S-box-containing protein